MTTGFVALLILITVVTAFLLEKRKRKTGPVEPGTGPLGPTCQNRRYRWWRKGSLFFLSAAEDRGGDKGCPDTP
jgi:hypothetical protein